MFILRPTAFISHEKRQLQFKAASCGMTLAHLFLKLAPLFFPHLAADFQFLRDGLLIDLLPLLTFRLNHRIRIQKVKAWCSTLTLSYLSDIRSLPEDIGLEVWNVTKAENSRAPRFNFLASFVLARSWEGESSLGVMVKYYSSGVKKQWLPATLQLSFRGCG